MNEIVQLSQSTSVSNKEKVAMLSKYWAQSIAAMQDKAENDHMNKMVGQLSKAVEQVLVPSAEGSKGVSADAQGALNDVKKQIKPYMAFMKMLCPDLILPPEVSK